jgi:hypothetical protein
MTTLMKYLARWQLSTPVLAVCVLYLPFGGVWNAIIANLIGGILFYRVDNWIFKDKLSKNSLKYT